ncbi:MAG: sugar ABC transporter substrate-binding protein [Chloroflexota bacterium]|jgi:multiple sugar transport system substrate-binding protein|nr:sugar ABC transporter substrate-binding protein [Chloroflexota bacterium]
MNNKTKISRRSFLGGLAALSALPVVAACTAPAPAGAPAAAPAQEVTTIEFITPGALGLERTMYENFVLKFMDENPSIKVNVSFEAWNDYMTKLPTLLAGGVIPDMIHQHMSIVQDYAYRGALADLVPWMERDNVKPEDYIPALFDAFSHVGKTYGIPKDSAAWGIYYNKDMFDAAGLPYPAGNWTLEDFHNSALALTLDAEGRPATDPSFDAGNIDQWGFTWWNEVTPTFTESARGFVKAFGGDWYDEAYTQTLITDQPVLDHFQMFADMRCTENCIPTPAQALGQGSPFRSGLTAMTVDFHQNTFFSKQENVRFQYDVTFIPSGPGGQYSVVGCSGWAVPAEAKFKEEGWELVKYLTSKPVQEYIGQQKRWGVSLREAVGTIEPDDGIPEHFAMVHTDPFKGESSVEVISFKFPPQQSRIKEIYAEEFDPIFTCGGGDIATAAANTKEQVDALLSELNWT